MPPKSKNPSLSDQLRSAIKSSPFTAEELSAKTGIHRVNIQQFKSGSRSLPLGSLEKLAKALGKEFLLISQK